MIHILLDIEKDLRQAESALSLGLRNASIRDRQWFDFMEEAGFLIDGKFLPILDMIEKNNDMTETQKVFTLEAVACDLSIIAAAIK